MLYFIVCYRIIVHVAVTIVYDYCDNNMWWPSISYHNHSFKSRSGHDWPFIYLYLYAWCIIIILYNYIIIICDSNNPTFRRKSLMWFPRFLLMFVIVVIIVIWSAGLDEPFQSDVRTAATAAATATSVHGRCNCHNTPVVRFRIFRFHNQSNSLKELTK